MITGERGRIRSRRARENHRGPSWSRQLLAAWLSPNYLRTGAVIPARWERAGVDGNRFEKIDASSTEFRVVTGIAFV